MGVWQSHCAKCRAYRYSTEQVVYNAIHQNGPLIDTKGEEGVREGERKKGNHCALSATTLELKSGSKRI